MKKSIFFSLMALVAFTAYSQDAATYESTHYAVSSYLDANNAQSTAEQLEAYLGVFNTYFHYDLAALPPGKLKVKIFNGKSRFDQYVQRLINENRDDFVYLHYSNPVRSELVGYVDDTKKASTPGIIHQAFVQFLRAYVPNPPLWLREGFAVYFEGTQYNGDTKTAEFKENLAWLETFKNLAYGSKSADAIPIENLLKISSDDAKAKIQSFYPQSWGLVQYLAQTDNKSQNRVLWDSLNALKPQASLDDNSGAVVLKAFAWDGIKAVQDGEAAYYKDKKTFPELVQAGIDAYSNGKAKDSEDIFTKAVATNTSSYVPYYYLGLINYDNGSYAKAEEQYKVALSKGASAALTNYALGVNAFADNRFDQATTWLNASKALDATYSDKVAELLKRIDLDSASGTATSSKPAGEVPAKAPATDTSSKTPAAVDTTVKPVSDTTPVKPTSADNAAKSPSADSAAPAVPATSPDTVAPAAK